jgi:hypothetical protein
MFLKKKKSSWESRYKIITRINDVVYRIQKNIKSKMMVVHLDRLLGTSAHQEGAVEVVSTGK